MQTSDCEPKGCMRVISSVAAAPKPKSIRADLMARRAVVAARVCRTHASARRRKATCPPAPMSMGLCAYLGAILQGMAVQAGSGATKAQLEALVETSLAMWPGK